MASVQGKVILLTGGASGIGLATAKLLAARGASLSIADVAENVTSIIAKEIPSTEKIKVTAQRVDITDRSAVRAFVEATVKEHGRIDGCANIAGAIGKNMGVAKIWELENSEFDFIQSVNSGGLFNCLAEELRPGVLGEGASIVNVASILSLRGLPNASGYIASKHAAQGLTKAAAIDAAPRNIRVNCVAPGHIETPMLTKSLEKKFGARQEWPKPSTPFSRYGKPEEIGQVIAFLLSDDASFVTAATYPVDGGWASAP